MKICPSCKKSYPDDGLNFCLDDGSVLTFANAELPETVMMSNPMPTQPAIGSTTPTLGNNPPFGSPQYGNQPQFSMQPPAKKSKAWLWLLGIFGIGLLVCGGGGVLFLGLAIFSTPEGNGNGTDPPIANGKSPSPTPARADDRTNVKKVDLSKWVTPSEHGTTSFADGEFVMASAKVNYYYAMCAAEDDKTENATTRVSVRNIDGVSSNLGYGLIFNSDPRPLQQGYALLIDSARKRYRVVRHEPRKESVVVRWTASDAINGTSELNKLEIRHKDDMNEIYINDTKVTSVRNTYGFKGGVAGLYVADGIKIGFKDLEIAR